MKQWLWIFVTVVLAISVVAFIFFPRHGFVPVEFSEARIYGAETAQKIVALSDKSITALEEIAALDSAGEIPEALIRISKELSEISIIRDEAVALASQLERMAKLIPEIRPKKAREAATEAISAEVALVSRLISYNDALVKLFTVLEDKFQNKTSSDSKVEELLNKMNEEARAINEFNRIFNNAIDSFDKFYEN
jgi:hypothetical protein